MTGLLSDQNNMNNTFEKNNQGNARPNMANKLVFSGGTKGDAYDNSVAIIISKLNMSMSF